MVTFSKFCSESFYRLTDRRLVFKFRQIRPREIGEIVRCARRRKFGEVSCTKCVEEREMTLIDSNGKNGN